MNAPDIQVTLSREEAEHAMARGEHPTNACLLNDWSCELCASMAVKFRAALSQGAECPECEGEGRVPKFGMPGDWSPCNACESTGRKKPAENLSAPEGDASPVALLERLQIQHQAWRDHCYAEARKKLSGESAPDPGQPESEGVEQTLRRPGLEALVTLCRAHVGLVEARKEQEK